MHASILVVALNPSIDVEWRVDDIRWEEKNSIRSERRWPGGKGVNVARWLRHLRASPRLLLPLGGRNGDELAKGLKSEHLDFTAIPLREETRANIIVTSATGRQMRFNPAGPCVSAREWRQLLAEFRKQTRRAKLVVLSGSLPRGLPATAYAELISVARDGGVKCLLDCDGEALRVGIKAKPFLVKPNVHELEQWFGRRLRGRSAILKAASALADVTGHWVFTSLGGDGGLLVNTRCGERFQVAAPRQRTVNTVGAGDSTLAGTAQTIAAGSPPESWLQFGVACGSSAVRYPAGVLAPAKIIAQLRKQIRPKRPR